jgi:putative spermidine/putrescine transport system permease protein
MAKVLHVEAGLTRLARRGRRRRFALARVVLGTFSVLVLIFLIAPIVVTVGSAFTATDYVAFPPQGWSLKWFSTAFANSEFIAGFTASLALAVLNAIVATTIGTAAALGLARKHFRGREALITFLLSPLMLPAIVLGVALLQFLAAVGLLGSMSGVLAGHLLITVPYAVRLVGVSLNGFEWDLHRAALGLGATPARAMMHVVLPVIRPGLAAAATVGVIMSFDEVTISLFTTGPEFNTLPVIVFRWVEYSYDPVIAAVSAITIVVAAIAVVMIELTFGMEQVFGSKVRA